MATQADRLKANIALTKRVQSCINFSAIDAGQLESIRAENKKLMTDLYSSSVEEQPHRVNGKRSDTAYGL